MVKSAPLSFRINADVKEALDAAAKKDMRSVSSMAEKILRLYLEAQGFLPKGVAE